MLQKFIIKNFVIDFLPLSVFDILFKGILQVAALIRTPAFGALQIINCDVQLTHFSKHLLNHKAPGFRKYLICEALLR